MKTSIVIVDDHAIVREGLKGLLDNEPDMDVVGMAENGEKALSLVRELQPDVVVMDISMPDMNGIEATRRIVAEVPASRVLILTMESDRRFIVDSLGAGACGFVMKESVFDELATAIRMVAQKETYLGPRIMEVIVKDYLQRIPDNLPLSFSSLTLREREIVQLIADGRNSKEIALTYGVSIKTVEVHRHNLMKKLNLNSVAAITKYAIREGLTSCGKSD